MMSWRGTEPSLPRLTNGPPTERHPTRDDVFISILFLRACNLARDQPSTATGLQQWCVTRRDTARFLSIPRFEACFRDDCYREQDLCRPSRPTSALPPLQNYRPILLDIGSLESSAARLCLRRAGIAIPAPQHKEPKKRELRPRAEEPIASVGERAPLLIFPFTHRCRGAASYSEIDRTEMHP